jgi:glucose 1-dehydrogenase
MESLKDKIFVITGSTRGFGYATAEAALKAGATVVISGRSEESLQRALQSLSTLGPVTGRVCDVREADQVYALARFAVGTFGRIDVWINNAGYSSAAGRILDFPPEQVIDMFLANDMGTYYGTQAALFFMLPRREGVLVNIYGAGSFLRPASPTGPYGATKAWVTSFTRTLATEIKGSGVRLIGFSPGMMLTDMLTSPTIIGAQGSEMMKNYGFVLRFLGKSPQKAADELVRAVTGIKKDFTEYRMFKPWTPLLGLLRVGWENLTKTGKTPGFELKFIEAYKPPIE